MASFSSKIQILKLNDIEKGVSAKSGKPWERHTAETMLLDDNNLCLKVGKLDIAPAMRGTVNVGQYIASFGLDVPDYGPNQGRITSFLTGLMPMPAGATRTPPVATAAPIAPVAPKV